MTWRGSTDLAHVIVSQRVATRCRPLVAVLTGKSGPAFSRESYRHTSSCSVTYGDATPVSSAIRARFPCSRLANPKMPGHINPQPKAVMLADTVSQSVRSRDADSEVMCSTLVR